MPRLSASSRRLVLLILLSAAIAYNASVLISGWPGRIASEVSQSLSLPPWKRAAQNIAGDTFADYIEFVRQNSARDARIVLPPRIPVRPESNISLMQFFLFPRDIINCGLTEVEECVQRITGPNSYILGLGDFPPQELAARTRSYIPFDDQLGLYGPP